MRPRAGALLALVAAACGSGDEGRVASAETVAQACGSCHPVPAPELLSRQDWAIAIDHMREVIGKRTGRPADERTMTSVAAYYQRHAPRALAEIPPVSPTSPIRFDGAPLGRVMPALDENGPAILNLAAADLDGDGRSEVVVCEDLMRGVSAIRGDDETTLALTSTPSRATPLDHDGDGDLDLLIAILGELLPTEKRAGGVVLLENRGPAGFAAHTLLSGVGRVSDARPGDLDGDGDLDIAVASFGFVNTGAVGWLEHRGDEYTYRQLRAAPGALHVPIGDVDGDGDLDITALIAQDTEQVVVFVNDGAGVFRQKVIFAAGHPAFGATGLEAVDLDRDGDLDFVLANGDAFDARGLGPRPYHGVRWLENRGGLEFTAHRLVDWYGAYATATADLDGDGDLDIAAVSMFNRWDQPERHSLIWLENDGAQRFTAHGIARDPIHLVTLAAVDLDADGRMDLVTGGIHGLAPPDDRRARVTAWRNAGATRPSPPPARPAAPAP